MPDFTESALHKLADSHMHFVLACAASRAHSDLASSAYRAYGQRGPLISGCEQDHFPAAIKDSLRSLARQVSEASEAAYMARPKGIRVITIRKLGQFVATRDGAGRYGPQPTR